MRFWIACQAVLLSLSIGRATEKLPEGKTFLPPDCEIIWAAPTSKQPTALWIYKNVPQEFSSRMESNLMVLGSFTSHDARKLSGEDRARDKRGIAFSNETETRFLGISPGLGVIEYQDQKAADMTKRADGVPSEEKVRRLALKILKPTWNSAIQFRNYIPKIWRTALVSR